MVLNPEPFIAFVRQTGPCGKAYPCPRTPGGGRVISFRTRPVLTLRELTRTVTCERLLRSVRRTFGDSQIASCPSRRSRAAQDLPASYVSVKMSPWAAPDPDFPPPAPRRTKAMMTARTAPAMGPAI